VTSTCSGPIGVPGSLTPGVYYLGAIADDLGEVAERNESSNAHAADTGTITLTRQTFIPVNRDFKGDGKADILWRHTCSHIDAKTLAC